MATGLDRQEEIDLVDKSAVVASGPPSVSSIRVISSMDKTPSGERDDELCISEELNVTDDDDKGDICFSNAIERSRDGSFCGLSEMNIEFSYAHRDR